VAYVRPPFTGKHETSTRSQDKGPHEGSVRVPYGEDPFQRVVDINFGGGVGAVFVSGDYCCFLRATGMPEPTLEQPWMGLGSLDFGDGGGNYASTYGIVYDKPTFLMSGNSVGVFGGQRGGIIMLSHDAVNWQTVMFDYQSSGLYYLVWDPNYERNGAFFAAGFATGGCYVSTTGYAWVYMGGENFYDHCPSGIPDGVVGIDYDNNIMILPQDVPTDVILAECTAFCGGIWLAGGSVRAGGSYDRSCTAASIDGGETWHVVTQGAIGMNGDYAVLCISGAPWGDFKWEQPK